MAGRKRRSARRLARRWTAVRRWCARRSAGAGLAARARLRPWRPAVEVDVAGRRGRRLGRAIARVARSHLGALGVTPPEHLLVVVQRAVVLEGRPLAALLQVFEGGGGPRRHVLFLATRAGGRKVGDEEVVATLRQQLQQLVAGELGAPESTATEPSTAPAESGTPRAAGAEPTPLEELTATAAGIGGFNGSVRTGPAG